MHQEKRKKEEFDVEMIKWMKSRWRREIGGNQNVHRLSARAHFSRKSHKAILSSVWGLRLRLNIYANIMRLERGNIVRDAVKFHIVDELVPYEIAQMVPPRLAS